MTYIYFLGALEILVVLVVAYSLLKKLKNEDKEKKSGRVSPISVRNFKFPFLGVRRSCKNPEHRAKTFF
ncbi:hypothetical protein RM549_04160 [Salegentibacter sp. F188]|uniref:Uncharacterized protein n=1 Tax=Autumnicola patrickiae TaxID=3075591 RepID=A0ABU3DZX1_9FLAO|nr:hypothetical protein [Salegentibacter sp. F188]MDT0688964.1 hypothetical protein [Salegentibacter sp. F188]